MPRLLIVVCALSFLPARAATLNVPGTHAKIQTAIDAAREGDIVLVAPGVYRESLKISGKNITLASQVLGTGETRHISDTTIDAASPDGQRGASCITVEKGTSLATRVIGFTFRNASHAVNVRGGVTFEHNVLTANGDALSFEGGTGIVRFNTFEGNSDDGIDMDGASAAVIEDNVIRNNRDDGIEVRLHKYSGPVLKIEIRRNVFSGNGEDGLQLIDYPDKSDRTFVVERNYFVKNAMAAIGCMKDGVTKENYAGAELIERVVVANNTFVGGEYGITGGDNFVIVNNVFTGIAKTALTRVHGDSAAGKNLLWRNGTDFKGCDVKQDAFVTANPRLGADFQPSVGSPCIDGGVTRFEFNGETLEIALTEGAGAAPDLGAFETGKK
jgi:hypothetical protein